MKMRGKYAEKRARKLNSGIDSLKRELDLAKDELAKAKRSRAKDRLERIAIAEKNLQSLLR